ncbi:MAG: hypothetical protein WD044_00005, partial [Dongiaceae bacterium]
AELQNPRTRRGAWLALLGSFARQIVDEGKLLNGETSNERVHANLIDNDNIVSIQGEKDALETKSAAKFLKAGVPLAMPSFSQEEENEIEALGSKYRFIANAMETLQLSEAGKLLHHYLDGSGELYTIDPEFLRQYDDVSEADARLKEDFEYWLGNPDESGDERERILYALINMPSGGDFQASSKWDETITPGTGGVFGEGYKRWLVPGLTLATGNSNLHGIGTFSFHKEGAEINFIGTVAVHLGKNTDGDMYDFSNEMVFKVPGIEYAIRGSELNRLIDDGKAKVFQMKSEWLYNLTGTIKVEGKGLVLKSIQWGGELGGTE